MYLNPAEATGRKILLPDLLTGRDRRRNRQRQWLSHYSTPLISFTIIAPGSVKDSLLTRKIFNHGVRALQDLLQKMLWLVKKQAAFAAATGPEALLAVQASAEQLKRAVMGLEDKHKLGRLWDFDILTADSKILSRCDLDLPARLCLLCNRPATLCRYESSHSLAELQNFMKELLHATESYIGR